MKLIKGARTIRRYMVDGKPDKTDGEWLTRLQNQFQTHSFKNAEDNQMIEERVGWVTANSILDADFSQIPKWYLEPYIYGQFRVDKKTLPSNLYRAMYEMRVKEWLVSNNRERIPKRERDEIKDLLSAQLFAKTLPRVKSVEFCWNVEKQYLILLNLSDAFNDKFCEYFYTTFGHVLQVQTPLMFLEEDDENLETMTKCGVSSLRVNAVD